MSVKTVYLAGPITDDASNPYAWHEAIQDHAEDINWINPFKLHDYDRTDVRDHTDQIIRQDLAVVRTADAVLLRRIDAYNLCGASMEAREAHVHEVPVVVWNDAPTAVPLFLEGHAHDIKSSIEEAVEAIRSLTGSHPPDA